MINPEDHTRARSVPTHVVNKFMIEPESGTIRMTFGEGFGDQNFWHWAQKMSVADATELCALLSSAIRQSAPNS